MLYVCEVMVRCPDGFGMVARFVVDQETLGPRCGAVAAIGSRVGVTISAAPRDDLEVQSADERAAFLENVEQTIRAGRYPVVPWRAVAAAMAPARQPEGEPERALH